MTNILWGIFGAVLVLGLFAGGFVVGWKVNDLCRKKTAAAAAEALTEEEKLKLREEQIAFQQLLNYNSDIAYGMSDNN